MHFHITPHSQNTPTKKKKAHLNFGANNILLPEF